MIQNKTFDNPAIEENVANMLPIVGLENRPLTKGNNDENEFIDVLREYIDSNEYQDIFQEASNNEEDIYYNKFKYESGDINILFITGYSGSGKSTMSKSQQKFLREVIDMDKIILFTNKSDEYFKKMGQFAIEFMINGPGKKYRTEKDVTLKNMSDSFRKQISKEMVKFAKKYARNNKRKKLVLEGVWIYRYIEPSEIDDCAVYIKGTSLSTSTERDIKEFDKDGKGIVLKQAHKISKYFMASKDMLFQPLKRHQKYFYDKYKKQEATGFIDYDKKLKNFTKGIIHDTANKIRKMTESEEYIMEDMLFTEAVQNYINDPDLPYDSIVEEGVKDFAGKIKERVVVSNKTAKLVVDIYILKKKIKKSEKKSNDLKTIDLKRELVQKQRELLEIKRTASPQLQKEISKIEDNLEKHTPEIDTEDIKIESVDEEVNDTENIIIEKEDDDKKTLRPELKRLDEVRGRIENLNDELDIAKKKFAETGEKIYENKIKGLTSKIEKISKELEKKEKEVEEFNKENKKSDEKEVEESVEIFTEAANMEDEIKPIVNTLNRKGYKVKYASPGHKNLRKKEDKEPDGVYYSKLYSDARIMFDDKYNFPNAPKYWHWREVDGCSYLDITPFTYNKDDGTPDQAFTKWKNNYMNTLKTFVDDLENLSDKDVKESLEEFSYSLMEEIYESMDSESFIDDVFLVNESLDIIEESSNDIISELDNLLS